MTYIIVLMTVPHKSEAEKIARQLLEERLIACANVLDSISSLFLWKGKIEREDEALVLMKSNEKLFKKLTQRVRELHSYDVPEILAIPIIYGSETYMEWLKNSLETVK